MNYDEVGYNSYVSEQFILFLNPDALTLSSLFFKIINR